MRTLVYQVTDGNLALNLSNTDSVRDMIGICTGTVKAWCKANGYDYKLIELQPDDPSGSFKGYLDHPMTMARFQVTQGMDYDRYLYVDLDVAVSSNAPELPHERLSMSWWDDHWNSGVILYDQEGKGVLKGMFDAPRFTAYADQDVIARYISEEITDLTCAWNSKTKRHDQYEKRHYFHHFCNRKGKSYFWSWHAINQNDLFRSERRFANEEA